MGDHPRYETLLDHTAETLLNAVDSTVGWFPDRIPDLRALVEHLLSLMGEAPAGPDRDESTLELGRFLLLVAGGAPPARVLDALARAGGER